jgi:hypothetical protein
MKVQDLIKDTLWLPNDSRSSAPPIVSVLWPSYAREGDTLFLKAAQSVLNQTLPDLELIIVDDGMSDGVAGAIRDLMAADPRVSCLHRPRNIGLPAVSEFEAFTRARGKFFAFAFDDFVFDRNALSHLVDAAADSPGSAVYGFAEWFDERDRQHFYGKDPAPEEGLKFHNFLCNSSFLVPRAILEDVGLYDPHIAATRLCDWDLWRRIQRKYPIRRVPVLVGREYGNTRPGSLGKSYPLIEEAMQEFFGADRDDLLRPQNLADRDVWQLPSGSSSSLTSHIVTLRYFFKGTRGWARRLSAEVEVPTITAPTRPIIGIFGPLSRLTPMIFDALHDHEEYKIIYVLPHRDSSYLQCCLAQCSILIVAADPFDPRTEYALNICSLLNISTYYLHEHAAGFTFDNLNKFVEQNRDKIEALLGRLSGSLCSSKEMAYFVHKNWPHHVIHEIPFAFDRCRMEKISRVKSKTGEALHVGVLGEQHSDIPELAAALQALSSTRSVQVHSSVELQWPRLSLTDSDIDDAISCDEFLIRWKQRRTDVLIVTTKIEALPIESILLVACYLGSALVLTGSPRYGLGPEQGVLWADRAADSYERALVLASGQEVSRQLSQSLNDYCASTLAPGLGHVTLTKLLESCPTATAASLTSRLRALLIAASSSGADPTVRAALVDEAALTLTYSGGSGGGSESRPTGVSRYNTSMPRTADVFDIAIDQGGHYVFGIPAGTSVVRLLSEPRTSPDDGRKLGAAIARITIDGRCIPLSDPSLVTGFHRDEGKFRWTDGAGLLPVLVRDVGSVLEIEVIWASKEMARAYGQATSQQQPPPPTDILWRLAQKVRRILTR